LPAATSVPLARLSAWYFCYFAIVGTISPYWTLYLDSLGFNAQQIGWVSAALFLTKIVAPNIWAKVAQIFGRLRVVRLGAALAAIAILPLLFLQDFTAVIIASVVFSFFWNAILAQWETTTLHFLHAQPERYSRIRLWGSFGFSVAVVGLGWLFDIYSIRWVPATIAMLLVCNLLVSLTVSEPDVAVEKPRPEATHGVQFGVLCFLLAQTCLQISHGAYYTFYSLYLENHGYSRATIGLLWALGVAAEILLFLMMPRLQKRLSLFTIVVVSLLLTVSRWFITAFLVEIVIFTILAQTLHAFSFATMHASSIEIIRRHFIGKFQGQGQALYSAMGFGLGGALGALISGYLWDYSSTATFLASALAAAVALFFMVLAGRKITDPHGA